MCGIVVCFVLFFTITNKVGIHISCILGTLFNQSYFILFWAWRSATLSGSTGTAFTLGLQSGMTHLGGVIRPQLFKSKWAYNGYKNRFTIAASMIIAAFVGNLWTWWLTINSEYDILRVRRNILKSKAQGLANYDDDIRIFNERQFYHSFKKNTEESDSVSVADAEAESGGSHQQEALKLGIAR